MTTFISRQTEHEVGMTACFRKLQKLLDGVPMTPTPERGVLIGLEHTETLTLGSLIKYLSATFQLPCLSKPSLKKTGIFVAIFPFLTATKPKGMAGQIRRS